MDKKDKRIVRSSKLSNLKAQRRKLKEKSPEVKSEDDEALKLAKEEKPNKTDKVKKHRNLDLNAKRKKRVKSDAYNKDLLSRNDVDGKKTMGPDGLRLRNSRVVARSRHVAGSQLVSGSHPVAGSQTVPASHPSHGSQSVVGKISARASQLNERNILVAPGARPSRGSQHVVGKQSFGASQLSESHVVAPGSHPSHAFHPVAGNRYVGASQLNDSNIAVAAGGRPSDASLSVVGNQYVGASQLNEINTGSIGGFQKKKNVRKKAQNKSLNNFIESGGGKPKIEIPKGKLRPVCKWAAEWVTEMGIIVRQNIPLTFHYWKDVTDDFKIILYNKVLSKFDVDMSLDHVRDAVDDSLKDRFKDRRHKLHLYYKSLADGEEKMDHPEKTITTDEWESLCVHFESEKYKRRSEINKKNRQVNRVNHRGGCKSFVRHRFDQRDPVTGEEPDRVEFYKNMRWNERKGWIAPKAEENYEKMVTIRSQAVEGGNEFTDGDIVENVLGKRSGYVIGLGRAVVPPSRKARLMYCMDEVNQLRARTEEQEQELNELRAWKASQEELSNAQQLMIDFQVKKQEETDIFLNALKQKFGL